ncbi:MAG: sterol desaturase family protein [Pseudolabrys sp.]|jgi:sterol desaturase/sphingolipid hydroxylase (fatty acid hydroxylase superfamily)
MKMSRLGYFSEFLLFPPLLVFAVLLAFRGSTPLHPISMAAVYVAGLVAWTLIEYWLHRAVFHHAPILSQIHELHHNFPQDLIGTPGWASASIGVVLVAGPLYAVLGFDLGVAATAGLATGYLWYVFVHYATHHWRPRRNSYLYRARLRHARHHHLSHSGNFGVTTGLWDYVFGTSLETRASHLADAK